MCYATNPSPPQRNDFFSRSRGWRRRTYSHGRSQRERSSHARGGMFGPDRKVCAFAQLFSVHRSKGSIEFDRTAPFVEGKGGSLCKQSGWLDILGAMFIRSYCGMEDTTPPIQRLCVRHGAAAASPSEILDRRHPPIWLNDLHLEAVLWNLYAMKVPLAGYVNTSISIVRSPDLIALLTRAGLEVACRGASTLPSPMD